MVGLVEGLHRDLPVAVEVQPFAPLVAHVLQTERVEDLGRGKEVVRQGFTVGVHVDEQPAAPGVDLDRGEMGVLRCQHTLPVVLLPNVGACAVQSVCPAVESADERLLRLAAGVLGAFGGVDQTATAVHAHVVVRASNSFGSGAHDDDRVVEDVVGEVAADLGDLLDPADLLPHLAPQLVALGAGVVLGDVGVDADGHRLREFLGCLHFGLVVDIGHPFPPSNRLMALRKDSSLRNSEVLSAPRWVHLRFRPPSTSRVWPVM